MYIAYADKDGVGSTVLHKDMSDAFNLLCHTGMDNGYAEWTMFADNDDNDIMEWARKRWGITGNPFHQQTIFFRSEDLQELFAATGVKPYIIHQRKGDLIFIPSDFGHQV